MDGLTSANSTHTPRASGEGDLRRRLGCVILPFDPVPDYTNDPLWQSLRAEVDAARAYHGRDPPYFPEFSESSPDHRSYDRLPVQLPRHRRRLSSINLIRRPPIRLRQTQCLLRLRSRYNGHSAVLLLALVALLLSFRSAIRLAE